MRSMAQDRRSGFTLIELLIVVAIIAILASIAVPNFVEAMARAKISRVMSDQRALATAMESYATDWTDYPLYSNTDDGDRYLSRTAWEATLVSYLLTSPIAYISALPIDPFQARYPKQELEIYGLGDAGDHDWTYYYRRKFKSQHPNWRGPKVTYNEGYRRDNIGKAYDCYTQQGWYLGLAETKRVRWVLGSPGPDLLFPSLQRAQAPQWYTLKQRKSNYAELRYDATNGTKTPGDILRFGP